MSALSRLLSMAIVSACLTAHSLAADVKPSLDSVLTNWEAATAKVKTLDAKVYRWKYDSIFGSPNQEPPREEGRFYYEAPNIGCLQIRSKNPAVRNGLSEMFVWHEKETLIIDGAPTPEAGLGSFAKFVAGTDMLVDDKPDNCIKLIWPDVKVPDTHPKKDGFLAGLATAIRAFQYPKDFLPLTVQLDAAELRKDYLLTFYAQPDRFLITAYPKKAQTASAFSKIEVFIDAKTYLTTDVEYFAPNGKDSTVWKFDDVKLNKRPRDRDQLLSPDLHGLAVGEYKLQ